MFGFLIAAVAGFLVPQMEPIVGKPVIAKLRKILPIEGSEHRAITVMIVLIIAAFVASIFDSGSAIGLSVGFGLGYFGMRIFAVIQGKTKS
jgi:hypothetical protein